MSKKVWFLAGAAAMLMAANAPAVLAQPLDLRTEFTFNSPVEMPGVTLSPGTYVFRFIDSNTSRIVMQVQSKSDPSKNYGMFLTINAERPRPSDEAELRFMETPAGAPAAVKTWWYPGRTIGREFIYPKEQARRLAMATKTSVLTTKAENVPAAEMQTADLSYVSPEGQEAAVTETNKQIVDSAANTAPVGTSGVARDNAPAQQNAGNANMSAANNAQNPAPRRSRLPRTDSTLPLLALMGLSSLAGGASLRTRR